MEKNLFAKEVHKSWESWSGGQICWRAQSAPFYRSPKPDLRISIHKRWRHILNPELAAMTGDK